MPPARYQRQIQELFCWGEAVWMCSKPTRLNPSSKDLIAAALILTKRSQQGIDCHAATLALEAPKLTDRDTWRSLASSPFDVIARTGCSTMFLCNADRRSSALALAHHLLTASPTTVIP